MTNASKTIDYKVFMTDGSAAISMTGDNVAPEVACQFLEKGGIVYFAESPFTFSDAERTFLLGQKQKEADYHKNIAYRPTEDRLSGYEGSQQDAERLKSIMAGYYKQVAGFLQQFLSPYAKHWKVDMTSFRPLEEAGRKMRLRARNDLLHVDSFATRPIYGDRILRTFININPSQSRVWHTSDPFDKLLHQFKGGIAPPGDLDTPPSKNSPLNALGRKLGLKLTSTSPYDNWMLNFHNFLKENAEFQKTCRKDRWEFPPNSSWIVFTDKVSHAVLSGQFALEQTFIVAKEDLILPQQAPINILKNLYGRS